MATITPQEVSPLHLLGATPSGRVDIRSGYIQHAGQVFASIDGSRLLCYAQGKGDVYYVLVDTPLSQTAKRGRVYVQSFTGYRSDVDVGGVAHHVNINLAGSKEVISNFLDIFMGCVAVAGGPVAFSITGMKVLVAGGNIKRNYALYSEALRLIASAELNGLLPKFYQRMYRAVFVSRLESAVVGKAKDLIKDNIPAPKAVRGIVGVFLGKVGEDPLKQLFKGTRVIIIEVLIPIIEHIEANKPALTKDQIQQLAFHHIVKKFDEFFKVLVNQQQAEEIIRETVANGRNAKSHLLKIAKAIDALSG